MAWESSQLANWLGGKKPGCRAILRPLASRIRRVGYPSANRSAGRWAMRVSMHRNRVHLAFEVSLLLKGAFAGLEAVAQRWQTMSVDLGENRQRDLG